MGIRWSSRRVPPEHTRAHQGRPGHTRADQGTRTKTGMKEVVSRWADQPTGRSPNCGNCPSHNPAPLWSKSAPIVSFPRVGAGFQGADASQSAELNRLWDTSPAVRGHRTQLCEDTEGATRDRERRCVNKLVHK